MFGITGGIGLVSDRPRDEAETDQCAVAGIAHASNIDASRLIDAMAPVGIRKAKAGALICAKDAFAFFSTIHQSGYRGIDMNEFTALDALEIILDRAQWCRENGESDMRNIIHTASYLHKMVSEGKSRDEIIAEFTRDEDE